MLNSERFTTPLILMPDPNSGLYMTNRSFKYDIGFKGSGHTIKVPKGFKTDLATIPRWAWSILPPHDPKYAAAAVLHDYLYTIRSENGDLYERRVADAIFYEAMLALGAGKLKAFIMYKSVRLHSFFMY
jgi:Protein of unknown function (DUF1353)